MSGITAATLVKKIDWFVLTNLGLFLGLCVFRYYARFIEYRGAEHIAEFFIYAMLIFLGILVLWAVFRHYDFNPLMLLLLQIGILMHFAGAFVQVDAARLYDAYLLGIRYDKYVHFVNAFSAGFLISRLFTIQHIAITKVNSVFIVLVVLGLGSLVEIAEYLVMLTIPNNGVGGYDNNMQDLISNLFGASAFVILRRFALAPNAYLSASSIGKSGRRSPKSSGLF
ncbi:MAG: hypothetical protein HUU13_06255 [Burkholderiaceae bacterium]|nr:hypothetical protein [Burkholderiaceae bacterium]